VIEVAGVSGVHTMQNRLCRFVIPQDAFISNSGIDAFRERYPCWLWSALAFAGANPVRWDHGAAGECGRHSRVLAAPHHQKTVL